jgi:hypothetical protein
MLHSVLLEKSRVLVHRNGFSIDNRFVRQLIEGLHDGGKSVAEILSIARGEMIRAAIAHDPDAAIAVELELNSRNSALFKDLVVKRRRSGANGCDPDSDVFWSLLPLRPLFQCSGIQAP